MTRFETISFLTDFGTVDESVGVVKSVIRTIAPSVTVLDITHDVPQFDVRTGSVILARTAHYLASGVLLAVVDPGVGTDRKAIAVEVGDGESILIGPDNGLLAPVVAVVGGANRVVELTNAEYQLDAVGNNFAARDVFAPVAAHLCNGVDITALGPLLDAHALVPATIPFAEEKDGAWHCDVIYVDHFGNLHLNVAPEDLSDYGDVFRVTINSDSQTIKRASAYGTMTIGEPLLMVDEAGMVAIAVNQASAADYFKADLASSVVIQRLVATF